MIDDHRLKISNGLRDRIVSEKTRRKISNAMTKITNDMKWRVVEQLQNGTSPSVIARTAGISRMSVYRIKHEFDV